MDDIDGNGSCRNEDGKGETAQEREIRLRLVRQAETMGADRGSAAMKGLLDPEAIRAHFLGRPSPPPPPLERS